MVKKISKSAPEGSTSMPPPSSTSTSIPTPSTFNDSLALPKMMVFDLDYTLWPFWVDTHVTPPLKSTAKNESVKDRFGEDFAFYKDVPAILYHLRQRGIKVGAASRTSAPEIGKDMLRLLHISDTEGKKKKSIDYFDHLEIYPGSKITHFVKLQKATGLKYEDMLFFDDESRNKNVESLGVHMQLIRDGVTIDKIDNGVREWRKKHGHEVGGK